MSIIKTLVMKVDTSKKVSVRGASGQKISVIGTSYVYISDKKSPWWRHVKVVVTESGDNFLLSNADLKNLELLSPKFPAYLGKRRKGYMDSISFDQSVAMWPFFTPIKAR